MNRLRKKVFRIVNSIKIRIVAISNFSYISFSASIFIEEGATITLGRGVRVRPGAIISVHSGGDLRIGDGTWIGPGAVIYCLEHIQIGSNSRIAHYTTIVDHDYGYRHEELFDSPASSAPIVIGSEVWIGASSTILKGVEIGSKSVIGATTLVASSIPARCIAYNSKPLQIRKIDSQKNETPGDLSNIR